MFQQRNFSFKNFAGDNKMDTSLNMFVHLLSISVCYCGFEPKMAVSSAFGHTVTNFSCVQKEISSSRLSCT